MIILDTGGLYAFLDADDAHHEAARGVIERASGPFILSPFILAELDYLVHTRLGRRAEHELLDDVNDGVYTLVEFGREDLGHAAQVIRRYPDLDLGVADASVVVLAAKFRCLDVLSVDQRHFRAVAPLRGGDAFRLVADL